MARITPPAAAASGSSVSLPATVGLVDPELLSTVTAGGTNKMWGTRVRAPMAGNLRDLAVPLNTGTGNILVGVYDTGQATAGTRTLLYTSGSIAVPGTVNTVVIFADPNLAVTAGQEVDLVVMSSANYSFGAFQGFATIGAYPTGYRTTGVACKLSWVRQEAGFALPATLTDALAVVSAFGVPVYGRIS